MIKRLFDITTTLVALLMLAPVLALVAWQIRRKLGAPVLFRQIRPGLRGRPFEMVKFRTMRDAVDANGQPLPDDQRLAPFGAWLRSTSLDELPELWNVLKGEMSLVGPRPLLMEYLPLYSPEQARRHDVRPGVTGWAQVNGRNTLSWDKKFELDVWYVDNQSLRLDLKILLLTIKKVFFREGINASGEATMSKYIGSSSGGGEVNQPLYAVFGASGFGREVMPFARENLRHAGVSLERLVFVDDNPEAVAVNGYRTMTYREFLDAPAAERHVVLAVANSTVRELLAARCAEDGVKPWSVIATNVVTMDEVQLGEGGVLCPFVTLTSNIRIGRQFHANIYCYVAHDCVIGDFVTFAPAVKCNGNIVIEDHVYIGTGAIIKQGRPGKPIVIGRGAVIGMGAVVTKSVPAGVTVIGNPARPLTKDGLKR